MSITNAPYGKMPDGTEIDQYTLSNGHGMKVKLINYGAIITTVETPDRNGKVENVTLYRDSLADYMEVKDGKATTPYFGATVGRYGNRIAKGRFTLDGKEYTLAVNNGPNALHGGIKGFDKVVWKAAASASRRHAVGVAFTYTSPDGGGRLSRHAQGQSHLQPDRQERAEDGLRGHDRQGHGRQSHEPHLLEPGRRRQWRHPQAGDDDQRRPLPAGR